MSQFWEQYVRSAFSQVRGNLWLLSGKATGSALWKRVTFLVATPAIGLCMINAYKGMGETKELQVRQPFVKYEHLRRRNKRFPWGDGERSLFHNPNANPLPEGYEA
ncbi:cytochrome c oxidase subunit 6A1, mitochondrial [Drosophila hydei]|uniref:Cytochrome c oxidase subunit 6A1, mitochondrial n=1 Tax=Drosophila hydei TaxID=7224 RepID=A0A6J1MDY8_DROHY|nr:cytochrome c oxidase subunit 6A1, mitochondrial [Drosophila hydei]